MGFRIRKSIKIMPGVRMTFSKSGVSYSAGVKGYRVTKRADGRTQRTLSVPGSGLSYVSTSGHTRSMRTSPPPPPATRPVKPGLLAPKGEKDLFAAFNSKDVASMERVGQTYPAFALAAASLAGVFHLSEGRQERSRQLFEWVFATGHDPANDEFVSKYVDLRLALAVVPGASASLGLDRSSIGLIVAELRQAEGDLAGAIEAVERLEPTSFAALSLAELYCEAERFSEVIELTNGVTNEDDSTAFLCVFRGIAFREDGYFEAARSSFKEALKSKTREAVVRHRALFERAKCYEAEGKRAMARKDLERILAEDAQYEGLREAIEQLV
jgi:tetratricopeptide (TPR) repeat protein